MPIARDYDNLGYYGRYLIYAQEPFTFPLGVIKNLSFPFHAANIARGSMPIFAIFFKLLSKVHPPFEQVYYFVLAEIIAVFLTALFTCMLLKHFGVRNFWAKLLASVLVALSFPVFFKSMGGYGHSFHVWYFPLYLAFAYAYLRLQANPSFKTLLLPGLVIAVAALTGYYAVMGICIIFSCCLLLNFVDFLLNKTAVARKKFLFTLSAFIIAMILLNLSMFAIGNQGNIKVSRGASPVKYRFRKSWGYGGGYGGGFHVADVLMPFIPPEDSDEIPHKRWGPKAYLTRLGFPITTADLQDGQYEAFAYIGSIPMAVLVFLIITKMLSLTANCRQSLMKLRLKVTSKLLSGDCLFSPPVILAVSVFALYIISWGYIIHIAGIRFNHIVTPSLIIALLWPKFMFVRSIGRLAIPMMLFIEVGLVIWLAKFLQTRLRGINKSKVAFAIIMTALAAAHTCEILGYLKTLEVTEGNEIANVFHRDDIRLIQQSTERTNALMVVPEFRTSHQWTKTCYSLAFHSRIPVSGATIGSPGERAEHLARYREDINLILDGDIEQIIDRYGRVAIASPQEYAQKILTKTNVPLDSVTLQSQDVVILTPDHSFEGPNP